MATLGDKKRAEAIANDSKPVFWKAGAWSFGLSHGHAWIFSAQLYPQGRGSEESDWKFLGEMAGAVRSTGRIARDTVRRDASERHALLDLAE
jgi:hypothetical protein